MITASGSGSSPASPVKSSIPEIKLVWLESKKLPMKKEVKETEIEFSKEETMSKLPFNQLPSKKCKTVGCDIYIKQEEILNRIPSPDLCYSCFCKAELKKIKKEKRKGIKAITTKAKTALKATASKTDKNDLS